MTEPNDRELEQYLEGQSALSRRYREASHETAPPELDEAILARARAEVRRKPDANRFFTPVAIAATVLVGVNIGWRLYDTEPVPEALEAAREASGAKARAQAGAPPREAPATVPAPEAAAPPAGRNAQAPPAANFDDRLARESELAALAQERDQAAAQAKDEQKATAVRRKHAETERREMQAPEQASQQAQDSAQVAAGAAAPAAAPAEPMLARPAPMTEAEKIDRLIRYIGQLDDVDFIRNGTEHSAEDAAKHLQLKRDKAGDRCDTAEEFIRVCASFSSRSGEAYLIRFPDGRTRTAEDVLREQLATMP